MVFCFQIRTNTKRENAYMQEKSPATWNAATLHAAHLRHCTEHEGTESGTSSSDGPRGTYSFFGFTLAGIHILNKYIIFLKV